MKTIALLFIFIITGCKENVDSTNEFEKQKKKNSILQIDYHEIIDVVLDTFNKQTNDRIIRVKYEPSKKPIPKRYRDNIQDKWNLKKEEKELAIRFTDSEMDTFKLEYSKLNQESQKILQNSGKTTDKNLTYYFDSFLSNEKKDLVISTVGVIMNSDHKMFRTANSGGELIMFFKKGENNEWKLSNYISTVEY